MVQLIYDIIPPKARQFYSRNAGKIKVGALVLFVIASLLAAGYFYFLPPLHEEGISPITSVPQPKEAQAMLPTFVAAGDLTKGMGAITPNIIEKI